MEQMVADCIRSQMESWHQAPTERALRMPLGLILLSRGWIHRQELQEALAAQRRAREGKIGEWLCRLYGIHDDTIAKALAIQWNCTVLLSGVSRLEFEPAMPRFLQRRYGLALVCQGDGTTMYLAGRFRAEYAAARAVESMLQVPVQTAFLEDTVWNRREPEAVNAEEVIVPGREGAAAGISQLIERSRPSDARLVRIHDHLWLRMWPKGGSRKPAHVHDVLLPLRVRDEEGMFVRAG